MTEINAEREILTDQLTNMTNELSDLRAYNEAITGTINELIVVLDKDLRVKSATKSFYNKFNIPENSINGLFFYKLNNCPWNDPGLIQKLASVVANGSSFSAYEVRCIFPVTGEKIFKMNARHFEKLQEKHLIILTIDDITDRRTEKNQLIENKLRLEERIKLAVESADMGTWEMSPETGKIIWDERCQDLFGLASPETRYEAFLKTLHPEDAKKTHEAVQKVLQGAFDGRYQIEYRIGFESDKDVKWLRANGRAYFDKDANPVHFAGTVVDITKQKLNEQLLRESESRFRLASDAAAAMIWLSSTDKMCNYFNKSWMQFTGRTFDQEKGNGWNKGIHRDDLKGYLDFFNDHFDARKEFYMEYRLLRHDGEYRWISDSGMPRFSPEGIFEGYIGTCVDIHDQKMTRGELEKLVADRTQSLSDAINNLETSNHDLEEFAYVASHDLQEPLRKIQTFANRLQEDNSEHLSDTTKLYLSKITKASIRMSRLISDLLNYSRLQKADYIIDTINLNEILVNVISDFDMIILEKKAIVHLGALPDLKAVPMRMHQLFHNLLSNALKFSRQQVPPVIKIYAEDVPDSIREKFDFLKKEIRYTMITFKDNGIGFNQEFSEKIFNIFQRLNGVGEYEGTGIGLAICKKIVINQQGVIFAESTENEGTSFRIVLPLS